MRQMAMDIQKDPSQYLKAMPEYLKKTDLVEGMMRKELGIQAQVSIQ